MPHLILTANTHVIWLQKSGCFRILAGRCGMDSVSFSRRLISVKMDLLDVGADTLTWIGFQATRVAAPL